jgi:uncharacterized protein (TIGR02677 family)
MNEAHAVFRHLTAPNAAEYRAVLAACTAAKAVFVLQLRPDEIHAQADPATRPAREALDSVLAQLVGWGNLIVTADTAEVATLEDFYRARFLYQLSGPGEAAEAALAVFDEHLARPGALQTAALADILDHLARLAGALVATPVDAATVHQELSALMTRFASLAEQARAFLGGLQRAIDLRGGGVEDFLAYKEHLIGYLERFVAELGAAQGAVVERLADLERHGIREALRLAAGREAADALGGDAAQAAALEARWQARWDGLGAWFTGTPGRPSQAAALRHRTLAAIPDLLTALADLNDRRLARSDRVADLRCLARWFAAAPDDAAAHRLWHAAFGLSPCRHLGGAAIAADGTPSWLEAEPLRISPRLRASGRAAAPGRRAVVADHTLAKAALRGRMAAEAEALRAARALIASGHARRLSEFVGLDERAFDLLLDCLGAALARRWDHAATIHASSADGSLRICAEPLPDAPPVRLATAHGELLGPDLLLTISDGWAA